MGSEIAEAAGKKAGTESGKAAGKAEGLRLAQEAVQEEIKKMGGAGQLFDASQSTGKFLQLIYLMDSHSNLRKKQNSWSAGGIMVSIAAFQAVDPGSIPG